MKMVVEAKCGDHPLLFLYYVNFVNWFTCIQPIQNKELFTNSVKIRYID